MIRPLFPLLLASVLVAACSSGTTTSNSATGSAAERFCTSYCDWQKGCGKSSDECDNGTCAAELGGYASKWRDSYTDGVTGCFKSLACEKSDDGCIANFALGDPAYPNIPVVQDCLAKRTECKSTFSDDHCQSLAALTDAARAEADACKAKPCDEVKACLKAAGAFTF